MTNKWTVPAKVLEVIDGDTVRLELDLGWRLNYTTRVRISRINCPELKTLEGDEAKAHAQTLLKPGDVVTFISSKLDKYGRPLGSIVYGPTNGDFGTSMIAAGHAVEVKW
jgi:endonuclease YncB( thermonuclease family)